MGDNESAGSGNGFGIAGLILGILSIVFFWSWFLAIPMAVIGTVFGFVQNARSSGGLAVSAIVTSVIGLVISLVMVALMLASIFFVTSLANEGLQEGDDSEIQYNDVEFRIDSSRRYYTFFHGGYEHRALMLPEEVEDVRVPVEYTEMLQRDPSNIMIVRDRTENPNLAIALQFLSESLEHVSQYEVEQGFSEGAEPVDCEDATSDRRILLFEESEQTKILAEGDCLRLSYAQDDDANLVKNAFLYSYLSITK